MKKIDQLIQSITMYRFVVYGLAIIAFVSFVFSALSLLPFTPLQMFLSLTIIATVGYIARMVGGFLYKVPTNSESSLITVLILFLTLSPVLDMKDAIVVGVATAIAVFSKFFLSINKKHLFNPAAFGLFLIGLLGFGNAIWWVGSAILLPFVGIFGLLLLRKLRKFQLFFTFLVVSMVCIAGMNMFYQMSLLESFVQIFVSWPVVFFGTVMLTEPTTMPPRRVYILLYAGLVGLLFSVRFHIGPLFSTPEFALIAGNLFSYIFSQKDKLSLQVKQVRSLAPSLYEIVFQKPAHFTFTPGEYMEWTYSHKGQDSRGMRRYFSLVSGPQEKDLAIALKLPEKSSSFKRSLVNGQSMSVIAGNKSGDFLLPADTSQKLVFIAGGIGITPMISMIKDMIQTNTKRDIVLFYAVVASSEFIYKDILKNAEKFGVKTVLVVTHQEKGWTGETGYLNKKVLDKYLTDEKERIYFLSGPDAMVNNYKKLLAVLQIPSKNIKTDYFPGY